MLHFLQSTSLSHRSALLHSTYVSYSYFGYSKQYIYFTNLIYCTHSFSAKLKIPANIEIFKIVCIHVTMLHENQATKVYYLIYLSNCSIFLTLSTIKVIGPPRITTKSYLMIVIQPQTKTKLSFQQ